MVTMRTVALTLPVLLGVLAGPAVAQSDGGWQMTCFAEGEVRQCEASQAITFPGAEQPLAQAALGWLSPTGPLMLTVVVPPDVALSAGLRLSAGEGAALTLPWGRCRPGGCFAVAEVTPEQIAAFAAVDAAGLDYVDGGDAAMTLRLPLDGFAAAIAALEAARTGQ